MKVYNSKRINKKNKVKRLRYVTYVPSEPQVPQVGKPTAEEETIPEAQIHEWDEELSEEDGVVSMVEPAEDLIGEDDAVLVALQAAGFQHHLEGDLGGAKLTRDAMRIIKNSARFLKWSYSEVNKSTITQAAVTTWLATIITHQYSVLSRYATHCTKVLSYKPSTVRNHICDIIAACEWYCIYGADSGVLSCEALVKVRHVATVVRKLQVRREKDIRSRVSMDTKVRERRMPSGGLAELQRAVDGRIRWAMSLKNEYVGEEDYKMFMGLLYAALYVYSVQGRISGVMDLTIHQAHELLTSGYVTTDQFKTNDKWGLQPVTLSVRALQLLELYLEFLRPHAVDRLEHGTVNALWICFNGEPDKLVGQRVTAFFKRNLKLHITTTAIRSLVETTMDSLHVQGRITTEQRASIHSINGHSGAVTKDYYIQRVRGADVQHAREAFHEMFGVAEEPRDEDGPPGPIEWSPLPLPLPLLDPLQAVPGQPDSWRERHVPVAIDFGTAHPDYNNTSVKAHWTEEEKDYVGKWCAKTLNENPFTTNVVAKCRAYILDDPAAWPIFHANHVLDSGRLRNGYRTWTKKQLGKQ
jgi:hypothetical protein